MTSLQNLQAEAREKFNHNYSGPGAYEIGNKNSNDWIDWLVANVFKEALQEALGKVFEVTNASNDQMKIVRAIRSLIPKKDI